MKVYVLVLDREANYAEGWAHVLGVFATEDAMAEWIDEEEAKQEAGWFNRLRSYEEEVRT